MYQVIILISLIFSFYAQSNDKVLYGKDSRRDIYKETNSHFRELSRSTAAMLDDYRFKDRNENGDYILTGRTLEKKGICKQARFSNQLAIAKCSGFLVGEDLLVTAGHCIQYKSDCSSRKWVFGYSLESKDIDASEFTIPEKNVYECKEIVMRDLDLTNGNDYTLIRLKRKVNDRAPLKFRRSGKIKKRTPIMVLGHPSGLPLKIADHAKIRKNSRDAYFVTNLDTFGGNSGSAVINQETLEVEGVLVRGEQDYKMDKALNCLMPKKCWNFMCRGEDVTRITNIKVLNDLIP